MLRLGWFALEGTITDQVKYMFPPGDLEQPEGTKRDLCSPEKKKNGQSSAEKLGGKPRSYPNYL